MQQGRQKRLNSCVGSREKSTDLLCRQCSLHPSVQRRKLTLLLDADLLPALTFEDATNEYAQQFGADAAAFEFAAIYVVGPIKVVRLA